MSSLSSQDEEGEDGIVPDPSPELAFINRTSNYKVGDKVILEIRNISSEQEIGIKVTPESVEIHQDENESAKRYTLIPQKYGAYKVTIQMDKSECSEFSNEGVYFDVIPNGDLKLRLTGSGPQKLQLPRDIFVDKTHVIIADGIRRKVIRMKMDDKSQEEFAVPCENFSPIGLAMKRDTKSEENNELYITDLNNACVHIYHGPNNYLENFGKQVLKRPTGIAIDDDGFIFVADHEAKRIFQFTPDFDLVKDESPHPLAGPQLMTIQKCVDSAGVESNSLLVADRRGSTVSVFNITRRDDDDIGKELSHVTDLKIDVDDSCKYVMPFSVHCDPDNHIFIAGQITTQNEEKKGFIWFKDNNSHQFSGSKMTDWQFGGGMRNPGGMHIVDEGHSRYLYIADMRGKNANNCINKYLLCDI